MPKGNVSILLFLPTYLPYGLKYVVLKADGSPYPSSLLHKKVRCSGLSMLISRKTSTVHVTKPQV